MLKLRKSKYDFATWEANTYSLVSLSFSKALLGFLEVLVSKRRNDESHKVTLTIRVCLAHCGMRSIDTKILIINNTPLLLYY